MMKRQRQANVFMRCGELLQQRFWRRGVTHAYNGACMRQAATNLLGNTQALRGDGLMNIHFRYFTSVQAARL